MRQTEQLDLLKAQVRDAWAHVAIGSKHIRQQEHRVAEKKMRGQDARLSEALLATFKQTQALHEHLPAAFGRTVRFCAYGSLIALACQPWRARNLRSGDRQNVPSVIRSYETRERNMLVRHYAR